MAQFALSGTYRTRLVSHRVSKYSAISMTTSRFGLSVGHCVIGSASSAESPPG